jgi:hypothetical protein
MPEVILLLSDDDDDELCEINQEDAPDEPVELDEGC